MTDYSTDDQDELADDLKHACMRGRVLLNTLADRLAVIAYRKEVLSLDELTDIQGRLIDLAHIVVVHTVGYHSALPAECECDEDADTCALEVYSDGSPIYSLVRDFSAEHPTPSEYLPSEYLTGDIWDLPPGTEVVIEAPPHKRVAGLR
jgi:hypothetical protein